MPEATIYRKDYCPPSYTASTVNLTFDLYEDHALVSNTMKLKRQHPGELVLLGTEIELISIALDGQALSTNQYILEKNHLTIPNCQDEINVTILTKIYPKQNTKLSGLYCSNGIFCTQCEAEGFRSMSYFLDRPDVLAVYTTRISADKTKYPVLLSNGNLQDSGESDDGRHWVVWHDPFKKPSYLFALVAGNLVRVSDQFITGSGRTVDLHIYVEPGNENKCQHAMNSLKKAMHWDEVEFGREYDLDIFMIVAVNDFNFGAMENKGLNIFNAKYILARPDTATDVDYIHIEAVVGHEYFHNWSGNRVTCRDWFQLSLKEGFTVFREQEFSRDMNSRDVYRIMDVKELRTMQFPEDASSMAHPVRPESYQEINNFYTPTIYNKGAEVIRMQQTLLSKEGFRRGTDLYFERHDGHAVTIDDFVKAMEDANGIDLTQFKRWYSQAGTPEVAVKSVYQDHCLELTLTQACPQTPEAPSKKPFHIPIRIAMFDSKGEFIPIKQAVLELREVEQTFIFDKLPHKPVVSLLREFSAPIKLHRDASEEELLALLRFEKDGFAKWDAAQNLALNCIRHCYCTNQAKWQISSNLTSAYRHVLQDESLDMALRAELLTPPSYEDVAMSLTEIDPVLIEMVRDFFLASLGTALFAELEQTYRTLWELEDHNMDSNAYGRRQLRNTCLNLMMKTKEKSAFVHCQQLFKNAKTMTDQLASLNGLINYSNVEVGQEAVEHFYQQWHHDELVLDKWFSAQALCKLPGTLQKVKNLLSHPAFNIKNPNKVRALMTTFTQNHRHFHALDGSGYVFLTNFILKIDKINPQVAARLAIPFSRWQHLNEVRQKQVVKQLKQLSASNISRNLRELVDKSIQG